MRYNNASVERLPMAEVIRHSGRRALSQLVRRYWQPVYVYLRRKGYDAEQAQDLTQEFFTRFLEKDLLKKVERERGKFRTFVLAALHYFLAKEWEYARAEKRGGGRKVYSLDFAQAEANLPTEPRTEETPEKIFDRNWSLAVLNRVLERLEEDLTMGMSPDRVQQVMGTADQIYPPGTHGILWPDPEEVWAYYGRGRLLRWESEWPFLAPDWYLFGDVHGDRLLYFNTQGNLVKKHP